MTDFRFLHKDSSHGYTTKLAASLPHEPEAVTEFEQAEMSARARSLFEIQRADEIAKAETRSRCSRLRQLEVEARKRRIDPTRALAEIERGMGMLERIVMGGTA